MAITGLTTTEVNGVHEVTTANLITTAATATDEQFLLYSSGALRASSTGSITLTRCNVHIDGIGTQSNSASAVLSYNGDNSDRTVTTRSMNLVDTNVIARASGRKDLFLSDMTNSKVIQQDAGKSMFIYTQPGIDIDGLLFSGISTWEIVGAPAKAANIKISNCNYGFLNWQAGRLDFLYFETENIATSDAWVNGGQTAYMWNSLVFDKTNIRVGGTVYNGISMSWKFKDRDLGTDVNDVYVKLSSDFSGSMTLLGAFTSNSSGLLVGTYDSQNATTGASQVRDTIFILTDYTDQAGSTYSSGGGGTYDLATVTNRIEVRSYLHEAPTGFVEGNNYAGTTPEGTLNADYTVDLYREFTLANDLNITETTKATVLAYTDLGTELKLYDRHKAEWRDNDSYALISRSGSQLSLGAINLIIDSTAASVYTANTTSITAKAATYTGGAVATTGTVTIQGATVISNARYDCDVVYSSTNTTLTNITCTGALDFDTAGTYTLNDCTITEVKNSSGGAVTINRNAATIITTNTGPNITINAPSTTLTISANVTLVGAEVRIYDLNVGGNDLGTELDGVESAPSSTFVTTLVAPSNLVWVQILKAGCFEFGQSFTMPTSDFTFEATLLTDTSS